MKNMKKYIVAVMVFMAMGVACEAQSKKDFEPVKPEEMIFDPLENSSLLFAKPSEDEKTAVVNIKVEGNKIVVEGAKRYEIIDMRGRKRKTDEELEKGEYYVVVALKYWRVEVK